MELRVATADDAKRIARLHAESWQRTYRGMFRDEFLDGPVIEDRLAEWRARFASPDPARFVAVAEDQSDLLGFVCVFGEDDARWGSLIDNLHVRQDAQKRGIGAALMRAAAAWCEETHPGRPIYLLVLRANTNAQAFYERLGGTNAGEDEREQHGGGIAYGYRYVWPDGRTILERTWPALHD